MSSFYLLLSCATTIFCCIQFSSAGNNDTDRLALLQIKAGITSDPLGVMGSWNESLPFCEWHGIVCGRRRSRVTAIYLNSSKLTGTLSPFVGNLSFLRVLSLFNNSLTGTIPPDIGHLHKLQKLWLDTNSFIGEIPSNISGCSNLVQVDVYNNRLEGTIPLGIGSLTNLNYLSLATNNLRGNIPYCLGNLTLLSLLDIQYNGFVGTIPDSLGKLKKLTFLALNWNMLSGTVPFSIFNLSSLTSLALGFNHLEGSLPLDFGNMLPNLDFFGIDSNQFTGPIPASVSNSSNLVTLQMDNNYLKGSVPSLHKLHVLKYLFIENNALGTGQANDLYFVSSLANATALDSVDIGTNNFGGMFPNIICNFSMLSYLALNMNHILGQIPICIENLASLKWLEFDNNGLSGVIPSGMGKLKRLGYLSLHHNQLSGYVPSSIGNLTQLAQVLLNANDLQGSVPSTLGNCKYLQLLNLSQNNLGGGIPPNLFSLASSLTTLDLSNNPLAGSLPTEVGELKSLDFLDVSHTMLSGEIPSTLGSCSSLEYLYMAGNLLQGTIPPTLITLRGLRVLDLSHNLSGKIPQFLENFSLQSLNLTHNNLGGEVPTGGVFSNVTAFSISANNKLCGGITRLKLPPCKLNKSRRRLHYKMRFMISFILGTLGVILLVVLGSLYVFCRKRRRNEPMIEAQYALPSLSYYTLVKATNGFSSTNLIGSGSVGFVYKGALDEDQTTVAIKVFNLEHRAAANSFMAECQVLRNVKHRNLLKVITACSSVDNQGNDFKALVYEYMANGSLEDWLHQKPTNSADESSDAQKDLNLFERLDIAVDIAFALKYLHHHSATAIVHCDLKPSNILFDDAMVAHVGDFGVAKFLSNGITGPSSSQSSFVGIKGTIGYAAPEYGIGNKASTSGDVYSFGILLLEMLTGRRPTDDMFKEGLNLHGFVKMAFPDHVMDILHGALVKDIVGEERNTGDHAPLLRRGGYSMVILEALTSMLGIALCCSAELPQERLDMKDVADELSSIRNKLLGTRL